MNTLIITEAVLIIKGEATVQLRISAVLLRKAGRWDVPYADIPEFAKYTDGGAYHSPVPMWTLIVLFLIWGAIVYKVWKWMDRK